MRLEKLSARVPVIVSPAGCLVSDGVGTQNSVTDRSIDRTRGLQSVGESGVDFVQINHQSRKEDIKYLFISNDNYNIKQNSEAMPDLFLETALCEMLLV